MRFSRRGKSLVVSQSKVRLENRIRICFFHERFVLNYIGFAFRGSIGIDNRLFFLFGPLDLDERILKQQQEEEEQKRLRRERKKEKKVSIVDIVGYMNYIK